MRYQVELSHVKWKKCMQMQMAMHCAPVLAGLKPSNAVTLDYIDSKELIQSLAGSDIKCGLIYSGNGKCLWLLYREQQVNQYLMDSILSPLLTIGLWFVQVPALERLNLVSS